MELQQWHEQVVENLSSPTLASDMAEDGGGYLDRVDGMEVEMGRERGLKE